MLDDHARGHVERAAALPGRVGVRDVVVAELLALQLPEARERALRRIALDVERGRLMRILAVAKALGEPELQVQPLRERPRLAGLVACREPVRDHPVVLGRMAERLRGELVEGLY